MQPCILHEIECPILHHWLELNHLILIDVREPIEYSDGVIRGTVFQPMSEFDSETLPPDPHKRTLFYCHGGRRSHAAALKWAEYWSQSEAFHLKGGVVSWKKYHYPLSYANFHKNVSRRA